MDGETPIEEQERFWTKLTNLSNNHFAGYSDNFAKSAENQAIQSTQRTLFTETFDLGQGGGLFGLGIHLPVYQETKTLAPSREYWQFDDPLWAEGQDKVTWAKFSDNQKSMFPTVYPSATKDTAKVKVPNIFDHLTNIQFVSYYYGDHKLTGFDSDPETVETLTQAYHSDAPNSTTSPDADSGNSDVVDDIKDALDHPDKGLLTQLQEKRDLTINELIVLAYQICNGLPNGIVDTSDSNIAVDLSSKAAACYALYQLQKLKALGVAGDFLFVDGFAMIEECLRRKGDHGLGACLLEIIMTLPPAKLIGKAGKLIKEGGEWVLKNGDHIIEGGRVVIRKIDDVTRAAANAAIDNWQHAWGYTRKYCSFHGSTLVLTSVGHVAIRDIDPAEHKVWSRNAATGEMDWQPVLARYSNAYDQTVRITYNDVDGGPSRTLISNKIHPFFVQFPATSSLAMNAFVQTTPSSEGHVYDGPIARGAWVDASQLRAGYRLLNQDGTWSEVSEVIVDDAQLQAFNLTVQNFETYFVAPEAGANSVWVHNTCWEGTARQVKVLEDAGVNPEDYAAYNKRKVDAGEMPDSVEDYVKNNPVLTNADFPPVNPTVSPQKQNRHIKGGIDPRTGQPVTGSVMKSQADAQQVLDSYQSGTVRVIGKTANGFPVVRYDGVTGINNNPGAGYINQNTNVFIIKGTSSPSIVPTNPTWGQ